MGKGCQKGAGSRWCRPPSEDPDEWRKALLLEALPEGFAHAPGGIGHLVHHTLRPLFVGGGGGGQIVLDGRIRISDTRNVQKGWVVAMRFRTL